ncbi:MAG: cytidylate kinase-like family protein [Magnetococcales bacterium]|nr:cytidylate kinase-like family protein [Magnetococcales bacterium]
MPRYPGVRAKPPVIMMMGPCGSGMEELASQLARHLKVPWYDPHKLDLLARDRETHDSAWQHLQESVGSFFDYWLSHLHEKIGMPRSEHLLYLTRILQEIASQGGVIAGACPHMILPDDRLFRIRVMAGARFCARRLAFTHELDLAEAISIVLRMERERRQLLQDLFSNPFTDEIRFDLTLNAEALSMEDMLATSLVALDRRNLLAKAA